MAGKTTKKQVRRRRAVAKRRPRRQRLPANVPEWASHSESYTAADGKTNTMYGPNTVGLDQFPRAIGIAKNYQEYRITKVKFTFKPQFDTFTVDPNAATALRVPHLFYMIDKPQAIPLAATLENLKQMGAKPRRFDNRDIVVQWSPGVQLSANDGALAASLVKPMISPWLNTNATPDAAWTPSRIDHAGLFHFLEAGAITGDGQYEYGIDVECQFQFRKPLMVAVAGAPEALPLKRKYDFDGNLVEPEAST